MISARQKHYKIVVCYNNYTKNNKNERRILLFGINYNITIIVWMIVKSQSYICINVIIRDILSRRV